jgi:hypothetical protein
MDPDAAPVQPDEAAASADADADADVDSEVLVEDGGDSGAANSDVCRMPCLVDLIRNCQPRGRCVQVDRPEYGSVNGCSAKYAVYDNGVNVCASGRHPLVLSGSDWADVSYRTSNNELCWTLTVREQWTGLTGPAKPSTRSAEWTDAEGRTVAVGGRGTDGQYSFHCWDRDFDLAAASACPGVKEFLAWPEELLPAECSAAASGQP